MKFETELFAWHVFKNPQFESVIIFFKFVHLYLLLYLLCYQNLRLIFWEIMFTFYSIWWQFLLLEFWQWHSSFKFAA